MPLQDSFKNAKLFMGFSSALSLVDMPVVQYGHHLNPQ